jgi:hypothetical protein
LYTGEVAVRDAVNGSIDLEALAEAHRAGRGNVKRRADEVGGYRERSVLCDQDRPLVVAERHVAGKQERGKGVPDVVVGADALAGNEVLAGCVHLELDVIRRDASGRLSLADLTDLHQVEAPLGRRNRRQRSQCDRRDQNPSAHGGRAYCAGDVAGERGGRPGRANADFGSKRQKAADLR